MNNTYINARPSSSGFYLSESRMLSWLQIEEPPHRLQPVEKNSLEGKAALYSALSAF